MCNNHPLKVKPVFYSEVSWRYKKVKIGVKAEQVNMNRVKSYQWKINFLNFTNKKLHPHINCEIIDLLKIVKKSLNLLCQPDHLSSEMKDVIQGHSASCTDSVMIWLCLSHFSPSSTVTDGGIADSILSVSMWTCGRAAMLDKCGKYMRPPALNGLIWPESSHQTVVEQADWSDGEEKRSISFK